MHAFSHTDIDHSSVDGEVRLRQLVNCFNRLFLCSLNTLLIGGAEEPFYQAPVADKPARIFFREDYFSSALHEIAHWCIAGEERRKQDDFGYWYQPEGRSTEQQDQFEQVEVKPQALEWAFSLACRQPFHFSADNLSQGMEASAEFKRKVRSQLQIYLAKDQVAMPARAKALFNALADQFDARIQLDSFAADDEEQPHV